MRVNEAGALDVSEVLSKMKYVQARYSSKRSQYQASQYQS